MDPASSSTRQGYVIAAMLFVVGLSVAVQSRVFAAVALLGMAGVFATLAASGRLATLVGDDPRRAFVLYPVGPGLIVGVLALDGAL